MDFQFKPTELIVKEIDSHTDAYSVSCENQRDRILIPFILENGAEINFSFIISSDNGDVAIRAFGVVNAPAEKRLRVMQACNAINQQYRLIKVVLTDAGAVNFEYDIPAAAGEESLGKICWQSFAFMALLACDCYPTLEKALNTDEDIQNILEEIKSK